MSAYLIQKENPMKYLLKLYDGSLSYYRATRAGEGVWQPLLQEADQYTQEEVVSLIAKRVEFLKEGQSLSILAMKGDA